MHDKKDDSQKSGSQAEAMRTGEQLSFAAREAYKRLRTNIEFSLPKEEKKCRIIGVTSSLSGEGKSTTSTNLAYTMAQTEKQVLLIEGDMRLPTLSARLGVNAKPGLSNLLIGQCSGTDVLQKTSLASNVFIITAGDLPPNPTELLGSERMKKLLDTLSDYFDVIIVDLPPVISVSDALAAAKYMDGILLVVRQDYCDEKSLRETYNQLQFSKAKILGFVMTDSKIQKRTYRKYGYGKSHGYYGYGR